jgi:hypothetical protein
VFSYRTAAILIALAVGGFLLFHYLHRPKEVSFKDEMEHLKVCQGLAGAHYRANDLEGGDFAMAACMDPSLYEADKRREWLREYRARGGK